MKQHAAGSVRHTRHPVRASAQVSCAGQRWKAEVKDLSLSGFRVQRPWDFPDAPPGWASTVVLMLDEEQGLLAEVELTRIDLTELGFRFTGIGPEDQQRILTLLERIGLQEAGSVE